MITIPMSEIPNSFIEKCKARLEPYTTTLIKMCRKHQHKYEINQIGSGTFVKIGNLHAILTANHVSRELDDDCDLGMTLQEAEHRPVFQRSLLKIIPVGVSSDEAIGPDLSLIVLVESEVSRIKPYKSFLDLNHDIDRLLNHPPPIENGVWFVCGTVDILTRQTRSEKGFDKAFSFQGYCFSTGVSNYFVRNGFDYFEADVNKENAVNMPEKFQGISGGGLWQILCRKTEDNFEILDWFLSGVVFYQTEWVGAKCFIRCHGRRSIYERVVAQMEALAKTV